MAKTPFDKERLKRRLLSMSRRTNGHLIWTRATGKNGYGLIGIGGKLWLAHRIAAYVYFDLDLDNPDMQALHKPPCNIRACIDQDHLYIGTQADNMKDQHQFPFKCGHSRADGNSRSSGRGVTCKICGNAKAKERRKQQRLGSNVQG